MNRVFVQYPGPVSSSSKPQGLIHSTLLSLQIR